MLWSSGEEIFFCSFVLLGHPKHLAFLGKSCLHPSAMGLGELFLFYEDLLYSFKCLYYVSHVAILHFIWPLHSVVSNSACWNTLGLVFLGTCVTGSPGQIPPWEISGVRNWCIWICWLFANVLIHNIYTDDPAPSHVREELFPYSQQYLSFIIWKILLIWVEMVPCCLNLHFYGYLIRLSNVFLCIYSTTALPFL